LTSCPSVIKPGTVCNDIISHEERAMDALKRLKDLEAMGVPSN
jgi:hypothetical protein